MRMVKRSSFTFMLLLAQSCNPGGYSDELSGDYFYEDRGPGAKNIVSHLPGRPNIYSDVVQYGYDKAFIVVLQHPSFEGYKIGIADELRDDLGKYPGNSPEDWVRSEKAADSILKNDPYYRKIFSHKENYWIISHQDKQVYGPFTRNEYLQKRIALKVLEDLELTAP